MRDPGAFSNLAATGASQGCSLWLRSSRPIQLDDDEENSLSSSIYRFSCEWVSSWHETWKRKSVGANLIRTQLVASGALTC